VTLQQGSPTRAEKYPSVRYIAPFVIFLVFLGASGKHLLSAYWEAPLWVLVVGIVCVVAWPRELSIKPGYLWSSIAVGAAVFLLWIAPDALIPGYRNSPLFSNSLTGKLHSSIPTEDLRSVWILSWRTARAVLIVPIVEELFWRAWLMRWLVNTEFEQVRLGTYTALSFWGVALLFASEHGPYWEVGLLTGIIYNLWMVRTRSVADCIVMHSVTNALLSAYVIATAQWQYWQ
jgi:CAAX prenyl protease-like protein